MSKALTIGHARKIFDKVGIKKFKINEHGITLNDIWHFKLFGLVEKHSSNERFCWFVKDPYKIKTQ